jgi:hypothetical protein
MQGDNSKFLILPKGITAFHQNQFTRDGKKEKHEEEIRKLTLKSKSIKEKPKWKTLDFYIEKIIEHYIVAALVLISSLDVFLWKCNFGKESKQSTKQVKAQLPVQKPLSIKDSMALRFTARNDSVIPFLI